MSKPVLIETSARHVHVSRRVLNILFGEGYELTWKKDLSQPGQFACEERVQVIGPKNSFPAVSILGPVRPETQVELSAADARSIGVKAPIRESGDLEGSAPCKIVGPKGEVELKDGVIPFHITATAEENESLHFDYTGSMTLKDGSLFVTYDDGQVNEESSEGGSAGYQAQALEGDDKTVELKAK